VIDGHYLVDLPGYGYAKVSKTQIRHWQAALGGYLKNRESLKCLVVVMDIRHALSDYDWRLIEWTMQGDSALHCLLTKSDKLSKSAAKATLLKVGQQLEDEGIECTLQTFSALKKKGVEEAHELLDMYLPDAARIGAAKASGKNNPGADD